ncbi:MAG: PLP-dependent transferase [Planctomycetes bacterium]|nr:PLP-dependent transferase [Planctomycetota bacterium]
MKLETKAIHSGNKSDSATGAITTPIYQTSTFQQEAEVLVGQRACPKTSSIFLYKS